MNSITGIITQYSEDRKKGWKRGIDRIPVGKFNLSLDEKRIWNVGVDQSRSCTGLCFQTAEKDMQILLDVARDKAIPSNVFYSDLYSLVERTVRNRKIGMLIMERPAPKAMYASRILEELKGHVESWQYQIPELQDAIVDALFPQTWKSYIVDKSKGKNRSNDKMAIAEDVTAMFPLLFDYYVNCPSKDYDSFDATGILNGFIRYAFMENGMERIHGLKEKQHQSLVGYTWVDRSDMKSVLNRFDPNVLRFEFRPKLLGYNVNASLHDNIRMASSNWDFVYTVLPNNVLDPFMWKYGIDPQDESKLMIMYVLRAGHFSNSLNNYFCQVIEWNERVYNE